MYKSTMPEPIVVYGNIRKILKPRPGFTKRMYLFKDTRVLDLAYDLRYSQEWEPMYIRQLLQDALAAQRVNRWYVQALAAPIVGACKDALDYREQERDDE